MGVGSGRADWCDQNTDQKWSILAGFSLSLSLLSTSVWLSVDVQASERRI